ncbi:hypothetical protein L1887_14498 [Cichorium endivia]|nr:hypothetical protein L1887_14498 [Cichorium endivia]
MRRASNGATITLISFSRLVTIPTSNLTSSASSPPNTTHPAPLQRLPTTIAHSHHHCSHQSASEGNLKQT